VPSCALAVIVSFCVFVCRTASVPLDTNNRAAEMPSSRSPRAVPRRSTMYRVAPVLASESNACFNRDAVSFVNSTTRM
jgi:hypothetical protein